MYRLIMLTDNSEFFQLRLMRGILRFAHDHEEQWVVCRMPLSYKRELGIDGVLKWAEEWHADAIVGQFEVGDQLYRFRDKGIVTVAQGHKRLMHNVPNVVSDYLFTGQAAADYFLGRGFRHFSFCGFQNAIWSTGRYEGFRQRIEEAGKGPVSTFFNVNADQPWQTNDREMGRWLQTLPLPNAIFCCDDRQASMVLETCNAAHISIPQDIAVLGVNNDALLDELSQPSLSSIDLDIERGGYELAELIQQTRGSRLLSAGDIVIKHSQIVTRQSTNIFATSDPYVQKAIDIIHAHIEENIDVGFLLRRLPLSRRLLEVRFKKAVGKTLHEYITDRRIEHFCDLLTHSDMTVKELALQLHFDSSTTLTRLFRQKKGCTPMEYRNKMSKPDKEEASSEETEV